MTNLSTKNPARKCCADLEDGAHIFGYLREEIPLGALRGYLEEGRNIVAEAELGHIIERLERAIECSAGRETEDFAARQSNWYAFQTVLKVRDLWPDPDVWDRLAFVPEVPRPFLPGDFVSVCRYCGEEYPTGERGITHGRSICAK